MEGYPSGFQFLVIMNDAIMNICVQILHEHRFLIHLGEYLGVRLLGRVRECETTSKLGMGMGNRKI